MKALITGIGGLAGRHLAEHLLAAGDEVQGVTLSGQWPESQRTSGKLAERVPLVAWDIAQHPSDEVQGAIRDFAPDCVYHLAAISVPAQCGKQEPTPAARAINIDGTGRVLQLAAGLAHRPRVLFVSSCKVYAPVTRESPKVREDSPCEPRQAYAQTKLAGEELAREAWQNNSLECVIARAFNHTGPGQRPEYMVPEWVAQLVAGEDGPLEVHSRDTWLDLSDVRDVVRAYRLLIERGTAGEVYNVGSGQNVNSGQILDTLQRLAGTSRDVRQSRPGEKQEPVAEITRLQSATGWHPEIPLEATLADTLAAARGSNV